MSYKLIAKNSIWLVGGRVAALLVSFFSIAMVARVYGAEQFGLLNLAISIVAMCAPVMQLGLNSIVTRDLVRADEKAVGEVLGTVMGIRAISTAFCLVLALSLVWFDSWSNKTLAIYISLMLLGELLKVGFVYSHWFEAKSKGKVIALCTALVSLIIAVVRLVCVWLELDFSQVVATYVLEGLLFGALFYALFNLEKGDRVRYKFSLGLLKYYVGRSLPLIASSLTAVIYMKIDQIMIAYYLSVYDVGVYAAASKISEVWYFVPLMIATAAFPVILHAKQESNAQYERYLQEMYSYLAMIGYAAVVGATFLGPIFIRYVYGEEYLASADVLTLHIWGGLFMSMRALASKWILAEDVLIFSLVTQGAGAIINVVLNLLFIPKWGIAGAAASTVIACATAGYLSFFISRRTWVVGRMMTWALLSPFWLPYSFLKKRFT